MDIVTKLKYDAHTDCKFIDVISVPYIEVYNKGKKQKTTSPTLISF